MSHRTKIERDTRCEFTHKRVSLSIFVCGEATDEIDRRSMSTDGSLPNKIASIFSHVKL